MLLPPNPHFADNAQGNDSLLPATFNGKLTAAGGFVVSYLGKVFFQVTTAGVITLAGALSKIVGGVTSFSIRNNADTLDNLLVSDAGAVTVRNGLTVTAGGETVNGLLTAQNGATVNGGALTANAGLSVSGGETVTGGLTVASGSLAANAGLSVSGGETVSGGLTVTSGTITQSNVGGAGLNHAGTLVFFGGSPGQGKQTVTGSKGANAALASLLTALAAYGLIVDSST